MVRQAIVRPMFLLCAGMVLVAALRPAVADPGGIETMQPGQTFTLGEETFRLAELDMLPYVDSEYARRHRFDDYENPDLHELRRRYDLADVIASGADDFEQQILLMNWVHNLWTHTDPYERGLGGLRHALQLLELARREQGFFCVQDAAVLVSAASSVGFVARPIGSSTHSWAELWSNKHRKWVMLDPTSNFYVEKDGVPLSTYEVQKQWLEHDAEGLMRVNAATGERQPMTSFRRRFSIIPNSDLMEHGTQHGRRFTISEDGAIDRQTGEDVPDPGKDLHFPVNQAALTVVPADDALEVSIRTLTPNLDRFEIRMNDGQWRASPARFTWRPEADGNTLKVRAVNRFGVSGPVSTVVLESGADASTPIVIPATSFTDQGGGEVSIRPRPGRGPTHTHFWYTPGHWLEWTFDCEEAGPYELTLHYAALFSTSRRIEVNGETVDGLSEVALERTGNWNRFHRMRLPSQVPLREGENTLRITCLDETSLRLAGLAFRDSAGREIEIDGAAFVRQDGGHARRSVLARHGFIRFWNEQGHWLEWEVDVQDAGAYDVYLQYATLYNSPRELRVNGEVAEGLESFALPLTVNWQTWTEDRLPAPVHLEEGRQVLRMSSLGGRGLNLTGIRLSAPDMPELFIPGVDFVAEGGGEVTAYRPSRHDTFFRWDDPGHWLGWTVHAPADGDYELVLRYATRQRARREVSVGGTVVDGLDEVTFEPTGDWARWRETTLPANISLRAGRNKLRLTALGGSLNLDEIRLIPVPVEAPPGE